MPKFGRGSLPAVQVDTVLLMPFQAKLGARMLRPGAAQAFPVDAALSTVRST